MQEGRLGSVCKVSKCNRPLYKHRFADKIYLLAKDLVTNRSTRSELTIRLELNLGKFGQEIFGEKVKAKS